MARNEIKAWRAKRGGELVKSFAELRDRLWSLKLDLASGKVKNVKEIAKVKRSIAQILTVMREQEREAGTKSAGGAA